MPDHVQTFREIFERQRRGEYASWGAFDDALWGRACQIVPVDGGAALPAPLLVYYSTRLLEWEVGNGGFAQAAMNYPRIFEHAITSYQLLRLPQLAELVRRAAEIHLRAEGESEKARSGGLAAVFAYFRRSPFVNLDRKFERACARLGSDRVRMEYVKANEAVFCGADGSVG